MALKFNPFTGRLDYTGGGSGDVVGPASSTDNAVARYDGTTGKLIQNSTVIVGDNGMVTWNNGEAITAGSYQIGRNADATNVLQFNVPTGASYEWSVNDVSMATLSSTGSLNVGGTVSAVPTKISAKYTDTSTASGARLTWNALMSLEHQASTAGQFGSTQFFVSNQNSANSITYSGPMISSAVGSIFWYNTGQTVSGGLNAIKAGIYLSATGSGSIGTTVNNGVIGFFGDVQIAGTYTIPNVSGVDSVISLRGNSTITQMVALRARAVSLGTWTGTLTTGYGLLVDPPGVGTTQWTAAIGTGNSYIAGALSIGKTTAPSTILDVQGAACVNRDVGPHTALITMGALKAFEFTGDASANRLTIYGPSGDIAKRSYIEQSDTGFKFWSQFGNAFVTGAGYNALYESDYVVYQDSSGNNSVKIDNLLARVGINEMNPDCHLHITQNYNGVDQNLFKIENQSAGTSAIASFSILNSNGAGVTTFVSSPAFNLYPEMLGVYGAVVDTNIGFQLITQGGDFKIKTASQLAGGGSSLFVSGTGVTEGYVGIGTQLPVAKLSVVGDVAFGGLSGTGTAHLNVIENDTDKDNDRYAIETELTFAPTASGTAIPAANRTYLMVDGSTPGITINGVFGMNFIALNVNHDTTTTNFLRGASFTSENFAGIATELTGGIFETIAVTGATTTTMTAGKFKVQLGGTTDVACAIDVPAFAGTGTGTNTVYGLRVANPNNGITRWTMAIGTGNSYIGGSLSVGKTTAPNATFDLAGSAIITQAAASSGTPTGLIFTAGAHTNLDAANNIYDVQLDFSNTTTFSAAGSGMIAGINIKNRTYAFSAPNTLQYGIGINVENLPRAGLNCSLSLSAGLAIDPGGSVNSDYAMGIIAVANGIMDGIGNTTARYGIYLSAVGNNVSLGDQTATLTDLIQLKIDPVTYTSNTNTRTVTNAYGIYAAPPVAGTNVTFTNPAKAAYLDGDTFINGRINFSTGTVGGTGAPVSDFDIQGNTIISGSLAIGKATAPLSVLDVVGNATFASGNYSFTQLAATSGSPTGFSFTGGAHTTLAASTGIVDFNLNVTRTVQFSTGDLAGIVYTGFKINDGPTITAVGASNLGYAITAHIGGAPSAGTNASLTAAASLFIDDASVNADSAYGIIVNLPQFGNSIGTNTALSGIVMLSDTRTLGAQTATTTNLNMVRLEQQTFTSTTNVRTVTNPDSIYVEAPVASTNVTFTNAANAIRTSGNIRIENGLLDLSAISAGTPNLKITATSDTPAVTWTQNVGTGNYEASAAPAGYMEITVGGNSRYIPYWA